MKDLSHQLVRGYQINVRVGADSYSTTYRAYQAAMERDVALKVIQPPLANQPEFIRRFEIEAQLLARLEHPHILPLYDYWREPEGAFLVTRWLPTTLRGALQRGLWSAEAAARLLDQIAAALTIAHREGIVHRRLTPDSILLDEDENAYVTDFGIGKPVDESAEQRDPDAAPDTRYFPVGEVLTARTNILQLGLVMSELLLGSGSVQRNAPSDESAHRLSHTPPALPLPARPTLPAAINEVLQTATARDPLHRYASALRFAAAFRAGLPVLQRAPLQPLPDPLTERELDILRLMAEDQSNSQIAQQLYLTAGTVKWYVQQLYRKLDVHSRRQAIDRARQMNLTGERRSFSGNPATHALPSADGAARAEPGETPTDTHLTNPYKGLRAFQEADSPDFFGRAALTEKLLARLVDAGEGARFLAIVGPSGSGKSSVARAGLIPALHRGALSNSNRWFITDMMPGSRPLEELEAALLRVAVGPLPSLLSQLSEDRRGLVRAVRHILPSDQDSELLLLIDQFEELFSLVSDPAVRNHFIDNLLSAVTDPRSRIRIVLTLRADYFDRPLVYPRLAELMHSHTEIVLPLTSAELERAIVGPAERRGLDIETGLVTALVRESEAQPGTLPLLQYTLTELFEQRTGLTLSRAAYEAVGGITGALARRAEELYGEMDGDGQAVTRQVFLRLVRLGDAVEDSRRRVRLAEIQSGLGQPRVLDEILTAFDRYRFLTFDRDPTTHEPTIELAHEALLRAWRRFSDWIAASRQEMRVRQHLTAAAHEWVTAARDPGLLATGTRLVQFETLSTGSTLALNAEERAYLDASTAEQNRNTRDRQAQTRRLSMLQRGLVGVLLASLAIALGLLAYAFTSRNEALELAQVALSRQLAVQAINELQNPVGNDEFATLLAVRSLGLTYSAEADQALVEAAGRLPLRMFSGHSDELYFGVFSPDGKLIVTASADHTARIWDVQTGQERLILSGHTDEVYGAVFSPDGQFVVTGSADTTAKLWDISMGRELRTFSGSQGPIRSIAISPDGRNLLTGSGEGEVWLWDLATGERVVSYVGHTAGIRSVAFSRDGARVLTGGSDQTARLWETQSGKILRTFSGHSDAVYSAAISADSRLVATGSSDNTARLWDVSTGQLLQTLSGHTGSIRNISFSPDDQFVLTASGDNTARIWEVSTGAVIRTLRGHADKMWSAAYSPDGQYVLTSSRDRSAKLWAVAGNPVGVTYRGHTGEVYGVAFSRDGQRVATASADMTARLWSTASGLPVREFLGHTDQVLSVALSPDGTQLLTGSLDQTAKLWDTATGRLRWTLTGHTGQVFSVAFSPDGKLALAGGDTTAWLWDTATGQPVHTFNGHTRTVWGVAFSPDGRYIITTSLDSTLRLWDAKTFQEVSVWNQGSVDEIYGVTFSPDSKLVLASLPSHSAQLWDVASGQPVRTFYGHTNTVYIVDFSPDGRYAVTGSQDRTADIWSVADGTTVRTLSGHTHAVWGVAFSPDGRSVLTGSLDGTARLWDRDYRELVTRICQQLLRDFSDGERSLVHLTDGAPACPNVTRP